MEMQGVLIERSAIQVRPFSPSLAPTRIGCRPDRAFLASPSIARKGKTGNLYHTVIDNSRYVDGLRYANVVQ